MSKFSDALRELLKNSVISVDHFGIDIQDWSGNMKFMLKEPSEGANEQSSYDTLEHVVERGVESLIQELDESNEAAREEALAQPVETLEDSEEAQEAETTE